LMAAFIMIEVGCEVKGMGCKKMFSEYSTDGP
jgi:hypothetical protein